MGIRTLAQRLASRPSTQEALAVPFIGIDAHKDTLAAAVLDEHGLQLDARTFAKPRRSVQPLGRRPISAFDVHRSRCTFSAGPAVRIRRNPQQCASFRAATPRSSRSCRTS
jgi:hypothetical protein